MKEIPIPNLKFGMSRFDVLKVIKQNGLNYNNTSDVNLPDGSMVFNFDKGQGIKTRWNLVNVLSCIFSEGRLVGVILQKDYHSNLFRDSMADLIKGGYSERFGNSTYKLSNGIRMWSWRIIESADLTLMSASDEETHSTAISVSCVSSI